MIPTTSHLPSAGPATPPPGCRTLIVEDDVAAADALVALAHRAGHEVIASCTLEAAMRMLTAWAPQCVVLDLVLPDGSGADLLRQIRRDTGGTPVRVALASGFLGTDRAAEAVALGPDACFAKPVDVEALRRWLVGS